jgi:hypothetical protein
VYTCRNNVAFIKALPLHIVTSAKKPVFTGFLGIPIPELNVPRKDRQEKENFDTLWLTSFYGLLLGLYYKERL